MMRWGSLGRRGAVKLAIDTKTSDEETFFNYFVRKQLRRKLSLAAESGIVMENQSPATLRQKQLRQSFFQPFDLKHRRKVPLSLQTACTVFMPGRR